MSSLYYGLITVTEREIVNGILEAKDPEKHCLWFKRVFDDLDEQEPSKMLSRFHGEEENDEFVLHW